MIKSSITLKVKQFWLVLVFLQQLESSQRYIDFLYCYNSSCYDLDYECKFDSSCSVYWGQFQKCISKQCTSEGFQYCKDRYAQGLQDDTFIKLLACFEECNGKQIQKCYKQIDQYKLCHSDGLCAKQDMIVFEQKMQECLKDNSHQCNLSEIKQEQCHTRITYECMEQNAQYSLNVFPLIYCEIDQINFSQIFQYSVSILLMILLI